MSIQRVSFWCLLIAFSSSLVGCGGSGLDTVPAGGVVNFKGTPIPKIAVVLMPKDGKGQIAQGVSNDQGKFKLQTRNPGDGALVGDYLVSFQYVPDEAPEMPGFTGAKKVKSPIPAKYSDTMTSGFTATIEPDASKNVFAFDLE